MLACVSCPQPDRQASHGQVSHATDRERRTWQGYIVWPHGETRGRNCPRKEICRGDEDKPGRLVVGR